MNKRFALLLTVGTLCAFLALGCADKKTRVSETPGDKAPAAATQETKPAEEAKKPAISEEAVKPSATSESKPAATQESKPSETPAAKAASKEEVVTPAKASEVAKTSLLETIHFEYDKSAITAESKALLDKNYDYLLKNAAAKVLIVGHCDERGTNEYNLALGDRRASSTKSYLVNRGIAASRLETLSKGEEEPADQGHDETAWSKNRRAQFAVKN